MIEDSPASSAGQGIPGEPLAVQGNGGEPAPGEAPLAADPTAPSGPNVIHDPDVAYDVATTSEGEREKWAASQTAGDAMEEYVGEHGERGFSEVGASMHVEGALGDRGLEVSPVELSDLTGRRDRVEQTADGPENTSHRQAEKHLERAERIERWAEILHGKQLKPDFGRLYTLRAQEQASNSNWGEVLYGKRLIPEDLERRMLAEIEPQTHVTAIELADLEERMLSDREQAENNSSTLSDIETRHAEREADYRKMKQEGRYRGYDDSDPRFSIVTVINREITSKLAEDPEALERYHELDRADGTTTRDRKDFLDELCKKRAADFETSASKIEQLLNAIQSGEALEPSQSGDQQASELQVH